MFSGIIKGLEKSISVSKNKTDMKLAFPIPRRWNISEGESVSIDGICSTVTKVSKNSFSVFYMAETLSKTSLLRLPVDHFYNLEQSLRLNDLVGGHLVSGHVDTTGEVTSITKEGKSQVVTFRIPWKFTRYIIYKGSIAVNGVSLTIVSVNSLSFTVSLIPYTLEHTNLGSLSQNGFVNIEVDLIAKYLEKIGIIRNNKYRIET